MYGRANGIGEFFTPADGSEFYHKANGLVNDPNDVIKDHARSIYRNNPTIESCL